MPHRVANLSELCDEEHLIEFRSQVRADKMRPEWIDFAVSCMEDRDQARPFDEVFNPQPPYALG